MRPDYEGIKYYGREDLSISYELEESVKKLESFNIDKSYENINEVIELYNIYNLFEQNVNLDGWTNEKINNYKNNVKHFMPIISKFFKLIDDSNFIEYESSVSASYYDDFWELFEKYKIHNNISRECFENFASKETTTLYFLLEHKGIVNYYGEILAKILIESNQTVDILVSNFMKDDTKKYYLPEELDKSEFNAIFERYIESDNVNPNTLRLIYLYQSTNECPISEKTKFNAKKRYEEYWGKTNKLSNFLYEYTIQISFKPQDQIKEKIKNEKGVIVGLSFDLKWIEQYLDYPTILNNFIYVFGLVDNEFRSVLPVVETRTGVFERTFDQKGKKFYPENIAFRYTNQCIFLETAAYITFLQKHDIDIFDIFYWFFNEYLKVEFNVDCFNFEKINSIDSPGNKCLQLATKLEGVLKQFKMYAEDGEINREFFEFSSTTLDIKNIPSLTKNKYAYANSNNILKYQNILFSNQTTLGYVENTFNYKTFYELIINENVNINMFAEYQKKMLYNLVESSLLILDEYGNLSIDKKKVYLLKDLYDHEYISILHMGNVKEQIDDLIINDDLKVEGKLFSIQESDYFNFILNKSTFSNGPELRNKYAHGNSPLNEKEQYNDYIQMIILVITAIIKINDEFVLRENLNGGELNEL